jgi:hypothetical protein
LNEIINGRRGITPSTALRLAKAVGTSAQFWLNGQVALDLYNASHDEAELRELERIKRSRSDTLAIIRFSSRACGSAWVAEFGLQHVHGLQEGGALAWGEAVEYPGQRCRCAVKPFLDNGPPGGLDGDDGATPVGLVGLPVDQARPVEVGENAADRRQRQAEFCG